jgi:hypothetical protein
MERLLIHERVAGHSQYLQLQLSMQIALRNAHYEAYEILAKAAGRLMAENRRSAMALIELSERRARIPKTADRSQHAAQAPSAQNSAPPDFGIYLGRERHRVPTIFDDVVS